MLDLGSTAFYFDVPSLPRDELERYSTRLFDEWAERVGTTLALQDYSLALCIEEGSVKGSGKIQSNLFRLYVAIGLYGSFISGLQTIQRQVGEACDYLGEHAGAALSAKDTRPRIRRTGGSLAQLQRLFYKVQKREMTAAQAMAEAEKVLGDEVISAPDFMQKLHGALEECPRVPQQIALPFDVAEPDAPTEDGSKGRAPRAPRQKPSLPPPNQFRIEVWRESKKGERRIRVTEL